MTTAVVSSRRRTALPVRLSAVASPALSVAPARRASWWPALLMLVALAAVARLAYAAWPAIPAPVHALAVGMLAGHTALRRFAGGRDLPYELPLLVGLVLVGAQVHGGLLDAISPAHVAVVFGAIFAFVAAFALLIRLGWLPARLGALTALGLSGFGVSAITAVATVDDESGGELQTYATSVVLLTGALGLLVIPSAAAAFGLPASVVGLWAGASIANTAEAVAAAAPASPGALHLAATIKLAVNALQGVAIVAFLWWMLPASHPARSSRHRARWRAVAGFVPPFVWGFIAVAVAGALGAFTAADRANLHNLTRWLFLVALVGVGFRTRPADLRRLGLRPALLAVAVWLLVSCLVLACCWPLLPADVA